MSTNKQIVILLLASTSLALAQPDFLRWKSGTSNAVAYVSATKGHYELVPELVPLPTGATQKVVTMRRMLVSTMAYTNHPITLTLKETPPYTIDISTNLVSWSYFDKTTNSIYTIEVCGEQQDKVPRAYFRAMPIATATKVLRTTIP